MMELESIHELYAYNHWANDKVLDSVSGLSWEEFARKDKTSYGSLWGTLVHIFGVEWLYPQRWNGNSPRALPKPESITGFDALRNYWSDVRAGQLQFLAELTEEKLRGRLEYINLQGEKYAYPLVEQMKHLVNHSTYHRGQVAQQLRLMGKPAVSTDYLLYFDEQNG